MATSYRATKEKRQYNRWVANETKEDFALRFTAFRARRWSYGRVANTAIGSISFLALEAIGAAVIGGTSLFGGRGSVWNAILGALVIGSLGNGLDLTGASAADKLMVSGAILLLAVAIDAVSRSGSNGGGR